MDLLTAIWAEIETPSGQRGPLDDAHRRAVIAMAHGLLGAALCAPFGWYGLGAAYLVGLAYWMLKERGDLKRGGGVRDGIEDAVMVSLGAFYGTIWWPLLMVFCGGCLMAISASRGMRK